MRWKGYPLQYSCLETSLDRGAWQAWGPKELDTTEQLMFSLSEGEEQLYLFFKPRQATGPVTAANSSKNTVPPAARQRTVVFTSFFFAVIIQKAFPTPTPSTILSVSGHPLAVPKGGPPRQAGLGPKRAAPPARNPSLVAPKSGVFSACLSLGRDSRGCKNLGARSLACQEANCLHILQEQHPCLGKGKKRQNK